jgi:hypothetical protein
LRPALKTIEQGLSILCERSSDACELLAIAWLAARALAREPGGSAKARDALHDGRLAITRLAALLCVEDNAVARVITPDDLAQWLRREIMRAVLPGVPTEFLPAIGLLRLKPTDHVLAVRRGADVTLEGLMDADKSERARVSRALEFSTAWLRNEAGPGRPAGTTGKYKYSTRESFIAAICAKVYTWPASTGRRMDSFSELEIARRLGFRTLKTMQQRLNDHSITWDDIYQQRL